jgi:hypothetical protein
VRQVLVQKSILEEGDADRRDGIDMIVCGAQPADVLEGLSNAMQLTRSVLEECCPGVTVDEWLIGGGGLRPKTHTGPVACVRRADAEAARARGEKRMAFGGGMHDIADDLLGEGMRLEADKAHSTPSEQSGQAWAPFEHLLQHAPQAQTADASEANKMEMDPKYFVYGSTGEYMQGLTVAGGLTRSMEQEFAENDDGKWKAEYDYVVGGEAIEVPDAPSDDPAWVAAAAKLEAMGLKGIKGRDQGHESMRLGDFCVLPSAVDAKLTPAEVAALRLYTGPPYKPMNEALRAKEIRKWATTISLVYSAVLKLSMLSKPARAYRGVKEDDMHIPGSFLDGEFAGGVELGFSSTTTKPDVALKYSGKARGSIFELEFTMTSRGASIQFLSQCAAHTRHTYTWRAAARPHHHSR